jgi:hypothetical protein
LSTGKVIHNGGDAERIRTQDEGQEAPGGEDHRIVRMTRVLETFQREKEETGTVGR